ncbi:hypothetical protein ACUXAV_005918 [Cupriavidus metallidurans]
MPLALHADLVKTIYRQAIDPHASDGEGHHSRQPAWGELGAPLRNAARRTHKRKSLRRCQKIGPASRRHEVVTEHWPFDSHGERVPWSTAKIC